MPETESDTITRNAKSNLAFTLANLPEDVRIHMSQFYAFCRIVDDIVDEPGMDPQQRHAALDRWVSVVTGAVEPDAGIEREVRTLIDDLHLDTAPMLELIAGCRGDISPVQPATRKELLAYSYKVAACVGLTSATVMGASDAARDYAVALGYALQKVLEAGARDAWFTPCYMKKNRPAVQVGALADAEHLQAVEDALLRHTGTIGVRRHAVERTTMERRIVTVQTPYGPVQVKECRYGDIVRRHAQRGKRSRAPEELPSVHRQPPRNASACRWRRASKPRATPPDKTHDGARARHAAAAAAGCPPPDDGRRDCAGVLRRGGQHAAARRMRGAGA